MIDKERSWWLRGLRKVGWWVVQAYLVSTVLWLAVVPLVIFRYNLVPVAALLIGPPVVLLTSIALITGFLAFPVMLLCPPLAPVAAWPTYGCLRLCQGLVNWAAAWPVGPFFVRDVPTWWLWVFYAGLFAGLLLEPVRLRWRWLALAGMLWLCVGLVAWLWPAPADEMRCTFLSVGHGGCTVIETPDGRTLLYDAGAMGSPDVARFQIAPFLWSRGVRRIDEVFLSHADADHFNGLPLLVERFAVGRVTTTPTFGNKPTAAVRQTLSLLGERQIPVRVIKAGDRLAAGSVMIDVLHPPEMGPEGIENVRSLVLLVRHADHRIMLTGDLSGLGMKQVLALPPAPVDVLMAPHHGSASANPQGLAAWARPAWVVSGEGPPRGSRGSSASYSRAGAVYLTTWDRGAVTVRSRPGGLDVTCFRGTVGTAPAPARRSARPRSGRAAAAG
jgi:competence protein ComEC